MALTRNPTCEVEVVHPMNQISEDNELQTALGKRCIQLLLLLNEKEEPLKHVVLCGTCSLSLYMCELYPLQQYMLQLSMEHQQNPKLQLGHQPKKESYLS